MFGTKRLKKKSQSVDISGPGCNPVAAEAQTPQPSRPLPAPQTAAPEEEQDSSTNSQRRNPRRSDLKRYYTIAEQHSGKNTPNYFAGLKLTRKGAFFAVCKAKMSFLETTYLFSNKNMQREHHVGISNNFANQDLITEVKLEAQKGVEIMFWLVHEVIIAAKEINLFSPGLSCTWLSSCCGFTTIHPKPSVDICPVPM